MHSNPLETGDQDGFAQGSHGFAQRLSTFSPTFGKPCLCICLCPVGPGGPGWWKLKETNTETIWDFLILPVSSHFFGLGPFGPGTDKHTVSHCAFTRQVILKSFLNRSVLVDPGRGPPWGDSTKGREEDVHLQVGHVLVQKSDRSIFGNTSPCIKSEWSEWSACLIRYQ